MRTLLISVVLVLICAYRCNGGVIALKPPRALDLGIADAVLTGILSQYGWNCSLNEGDPWCQLFLDTEPFTESEAYTAHLIVRFGTTLNAMPLADVCDTFAKSATDALLVLRDTYKVQFPAPWSTARGWQAHAQYVNLCRSYAPPKIERAGRWLQLLISKFGNVAPLS
jgi:hypothetical protein